MNATQNPMTVQMWLWGLDAIRGDLQAKGFIKTIRPSNSESSIYVQNNLYLHGHGIWLETETEILVYRRPNKNWYALPKTAKVCIEHFAQNSLAWCDYARPKQLSHHQALAIIKPIILEYEDWLFARHGDIRLSQLKAIPNQKVRRAVGAWRDFTGIQSKQRSYANN
jgi:hypothetical protein